MSKFGIAYIRPSMMIEEEKDKLNINPVYLSSELSQDINDYTEIDLNAIMELMTHTETDLKQVATNIQIILVIGALKYWIDNNPPKYKIIKGSKLPYIKELNTGFVIYVSPFYTLTLKSAPVVDIESINYVMEKNFYGDGNSDCMNDEIFKVYLYQHGNITPITFQKYHYFSWNILLNILKVPESMRNELILTLIEYHQKTNNENPVLE